MADHAFWHLMHHTDKRDVERVLIQAITVLSIDVYTNLTPEQIYDKLLADYEVNFGNGPHDLQYFLHYIAGRLGRMERSIHNQLDRMEITLSANQTALSRLQADAETMKALLVTTQANQSAASAAISAAVARLQSDIDALKAAGNDPVALAAVADSLETTMTGFQGVSDGLKASADAAATIDPKTPPAPSNPVVSPATANIPPGGTQQFTSDKLVSWSAVSGTIDASGLYTGPADLTITSDVVTATAADNTTGTAAVAIG